MPWSLNDVLQWSGATLIVLGHILNAMGPEAYPWNIFVFFLGTVAFLWWAVRVSAKPHIMVNLVSVAIGLVGLFRAWG
jgi:hypothetical protein